MDRARSSILLLAVFFVLSALGASPAVALDRDDPFAHLKPANASWTPHKQTDARVVVHVVPAAAGLDSAAVCDHLTPIDCRWGEKTLATEAPLSSAEVPFYWVYLIVTNYDTRLGIAGVQYGIEFDGRSLQGVDVLDYTSCSHLDFRSDNFPTDAGSWNTQTWVPDWANDPRYPCEHSGFTVVGCFTVSAASPDLFEVVPRQVDRALKVADCVQGAETPLPAEAAGAIAFGGALGRDPCSGQSADPASPVLDPLPLLMGHAVPVEEDPEVACGVPPDFPCVQGESHARTRIPLVAGTTARAYVYVFTSTLPEDLRVGRVGFYPITTGGVRIDAWLPCADSQMTLVGPLVSYWNNDACHAGERRLAGILSVSATGPGEVRLDRVWIQITRCDGSRYGEYGPPAFSVGFGGTEGSDPCMEQGSVGLIPSGVTQPATWGRIKSMFGT
jgi:hypothetical protein